MREIVYYVIFILIVILVCLDAFVLYLIIFKHRKLKNLFNLLAAFVAMLGVLLIFNPPNKAETGDMSADVRFFTDTYAIADGYVYKTLRFNSNEYGDYELIYTIDNNFNSTVKIDTMSLTVNSFEDGDIELISPEGGGAGDTGYQYYYGELVSDENELIYLGNEYGKFDLNEEKKSFVLYHLTLSRRKQLQYRWKPVQSHCKYCQNEVNVMKNSAQMITM